MKEKKLTDEEIVKAYEYCIANSSSCVDCPYDDWGCAVQTKDILEVVNRQNAEIERLTEENAHLDGCAKQFLADYQKCEIANTELQELNAKYYNEAKNLRREKAELQKQVDELKANQVIECHGMLKGCDMVKQAVKDTAKEVWTIVMSDECSVENTFDDTKFTQIIKERYGVEVE